MQSRPIDPRNLFLLLATTALVLVAGFALAADAPASRPFAPVQSGYTDQIQEVATYHPERILIQLTSRAFEDADLHFAMEKGAVAPAAKTGIASLDALCAAAGVKQISRPYVQVRNQKKSDELGLERWYLLETDGSVDVLEMSKRFQSDRSIQSATVDWVAFPAAVPSDPLYADHWGHNNTAQLPDLDWGGTYEHDLPNTVGTVGFDANAQAAWDQGYGSSSVVIAIIDSGVEVGHPDLTQVTGYDFGDNDTNPDDNSSAPGHGTACAGVAASKANNGLGACGIAAGSSIMPLKVANSAGSMYFTAIQNALYYAADNGADIISMSLGAAISSDSATDSAILYAYNAGCTILAATGNENASTISYPAVNAYVIGVGAASPCGERKRSSSSSGDVNPGVSTDPNGYTCDGERWWGSNYGSTTQDAAGAVDIIAPTILPTTDLLGSAGYDPSDYSGFFNGTSCATPYAAGVAALVKMHNPGWTPAQIRAQLVNTAQDVTSVESGSGWDRYTGYGMVDAAAAVGGGSSGSAPVAAFSGSPTSGDYPLTVFFTDSSSNSPTSWSWNFGDGGTSSSQNPSHTYTTAGSYTVTLTAANAYGSDGETKTGYITVTTPQTGGDYATLPYSTGFEGGSFDPYWTTTSDNTGRIQLTTANTPHSGSYQMTMDCSSNGTYSTNQALLHLDLSGQGQVDLSFWWKDFADETHSTDGVYFSDNGGSSFVQVLAFNPGSYTNNSWRQLDLDLTALASSAGLSLNSTFVVKFQQYDNYMISTDGMAFDDISVTAGAAGAAPVAAFSGTPTSGQLPLAVSFTDASTNVPTSWNWTFGDGGTSTAQNPSHTYTAAGSYTVTLTAANSYGSDPETKTGYITVTAPPAPVAAFTGTPTSGDYPLNVTFTDQSTNSPTSWSWNFGDGGTSTAQNPSHTYTAAGSYTVVLTATSTWGSDAETKTGYITVTEPGVGSWNTITYDDFESGFGSYTSGGGDCFLYTSGTYAHQGNGAADIQDNSGVASSFYHTNGHDVSGYTDLEVDFWFYAVSMDNSSEDFWLQYYDGSTWITVDTWARTTDFDNNVFYHKVVSIPAGTYNYPTDAKLRFLCDASGNADDVYIDEVEFRGYGGGGTTNPPVAAFVANVTSGTAPLAVTFTDQSTNSPTSWSWNFGDGGTSTAQNPSHTYTAAGTYTVSLTAANAGGSDVESKSAYITVTSGGVQGISSETENNGSIATANGPVGDGRAVSGTLSSSSDDDYFWLDVDAAGTITISVAIGSSADLDWYLYNSAGTQVARGYTVSNPEVGSYNASVGRYYVRVDGYLGATSSYTLTVTGGLAATNNAPEKQDLPSAFALGQNSPNPFNPMTKISFDLPKSSQVMLRIYDTRGHLIRSLVNETMGAGRQEVVWNGTDDAGMQVHSGVYFYVIRADDFQATRKMTLLK